MPTYNPLMNQSGGYRGSGAVGLGSGQQPRMGGDSGMYGRPQPRGPMPPMPSYPSSSGVPANGGHSQAEIAYAYRESARRQKIADANPHIRLGESQADWMGRVHGNNPSYQNNQTGPGGYRDGYGPPSGRPHSGGAMPGKYPSSPTPNQPPPSTGVPNGGWNAHWGDQKWRGGQTAPGQNGQGGPGPTPFLGPASPRPVMGGGMNPMDIQGAQGPGKMPPRGGMPTPFYGPASPMPTMPPSPYGAPTGYGTSGPAGGGMQSPMGGETRPMPQPTGMPQQQYPGFDPNYNPFGRQWEQPPPQQQPQYGAQGGSGFYDSSRIQNSIPPWMTQPGAQY